MLLGWLLDWFLLVDFWVSVLLCGLCGMLVGWIVVIAAYDLRCYGIAGMR